MHIQVLAAFLCYFLCLIVIGIISHRKQTSNAEFIVGNRSLGFWLTALSAHASDMSAWLFMGLPMAVFVQGLSGSWIAIGLLIGMFLTWQLVAKKLRENTESTNSYTLPSFFERRFSDNTGKIRLLTAGILIFFLTYYIAAGLTAMGLLIEAVFGIDYYWGLTFATIVVVSYTFGGGFITIAWTDLFQALFLLLVIIAVPIIAFFSLDGPMHRLQELATTTPSYLSLIGDLSLSSFFSTTLIAASWGLGYFGMPHVITKFMGIRHVGDMNKSKYIGMTWQFLALSASVSVGIVGYLFFDGNLANPELVFVEMVKTLFHPFVAGFVLCGVLAANLSTMDSQLLVCASAIGEDLYKQFNRGNVPQKQLVKATRIGVLTVAIVALLIAFDRNVTILDMVLYAWAGLGASFGPLVLMSLYDRKANRAGALTGIIVGGSIAILWPFVNPYIVGINIPSMLIGFLSGLISIFTVSRLYRPPHL